MKRLSLLMAALLLLLPGCAVQSLPAEPSAPEPTGEAIPPVADAALYRGEVVSVTPGDQSTVAELAQATGTDFGAPQLTVLFDQNSRLSFDPTLLQEGAYLEVYYGRAPGQPLDAEAVHPAIAANVYFEAKMVNFNGTLLAIEPNPDKPGEGRLELEELGTRMQYVFHYGPDTQFYTNFEALTAGDDLNIFHRGTMTLSLPPQGSALEVRLYSSPNAQV